MHLALLLSLQFLAPWFYDALEEVAVEYEEEGEGEGKEDGGKVDPVVEEELGG